MNDNQPYATPEGLAAAKRLRESPGPSARRRVARAAGAIAKLSWTIDNYRTRRELEEVAESHAEAAVRYMDEARTENDPKLQMFWLESAGQHALQAQVFRAKAAEATA